ncbi:hypothetical protein [Brevundimonas sp.]|uniref:hypothetical protein n=1 Tax=Brevundimonas sp. TaxID=1871086 RepID=UPI002FCA5CFB
MATDPGGFRLFDRFGHETRVDLGDRSSLKLTATGTLLLRHPDGVAVVDPANAFSRLELREVPLNPTDTWEAAFLGVLVDSSRGTFSRFEVDVDALEIGDPGYSGPTDAVLLPDGRRVAILIARSPHLAIFDPEDRTTRLVVLGGSYGSNNAVVRGRTLWVTNYDRLCRIDGDTLEMSSSTVLQPGYLDPQYGIMTSAFIGAPRFSEAHSAWLIPRPYSGDILTVSEDTLEPVGRIACGGRPYDVLEFDAGDLLILDHPMKVVRTMQNPFVEAL